MIAHIIHNTKRTDRYQNILDQAADQGFKFEIHKSEEGKTPQEGCSRAHLRVIEMAQRANMAYVLIMEDDVRFTDLGAFDAFMQHMPEDFDIYTAGSYSRYVKYNNGTIVNMSGTHCYIVHHRFFDKMLQLDPSEHLDISLSKHALITMTMPMCAMQQAGYSDIALKETDWNDERYISYPTFQLLVHANSTDRPMAQ